MTTMQQYVRMVFHIGVGVGLFLGTCLGLVIGALAL